tara:strand:+ start:604 stop:1872 length:1269 start_codon:yes stop_codon:yes gene_type:complete
MVFGFFKKKVLEENTPSETLLKKRQKILMGTGVVFCGLVLGIVAYKNPAPTKKKPSSPVKLVSANTLIPPEEVWVDQITKGQQALQEDLRDVKTQNQLLQDQNTLLVKRLDMMETGLKKRDDTPSGLFPAQDFPVPERRSMPQVKPLQDPLRIQKEGPRLLHLTRGEPARSLPKTVESYVPAGTYVPAILTSGVLAPTSVDAQENPDPLILRLVGNGTLPRGFQSDLKEAFVIASCYGHLPSERAKCRLETITIVERNGEAFESKVEGWIFGEDGQPGIKGEVIDRSRQDIFDAGIASVLGGTSAFFKQQATSGSLPSSLLSHQKPLPAGDALKGSLANGASSGFDKISEHFIKNAERKQPVISVASGRRVDVVFKKGLDLQSTATRQELKLAGQSTRLKQAKEGARQATLQGTLSSGQKNF